MLKAGAEPSVRSLRARNDQEEVVCSVGYPSNVPSSGRRRVRRSITCLAVTNRTWPVLMYSINRSSEITPCIHTHTHTHTHTRRWRKSQRELRNDRSRSGWLTNSLATFAWGLLPPKRFNSRTFSLWNSDGAILSIAFKLLKKKIR